MVGFEVAEAYGNGEIVKYRIGQAEKDILDLRQRQSEQYAELSKKLDRILWALVTACITIATALIVFVVQAGVPGN